MLSPCCHFNLQHKVQRRAKRLLCKIHSQPPQQKQRQHRNQDDEWTEQKTPLDSLKHSRRVMAWQRYTRDTLYKCLTWRIWLPPGGEHSAARGQFFVMLLSWRSQSLTPATIKGILCLLDYTWCKALTEELYITQQMNVTKDRWLRLRVHPTIWAAILYHALHMMHTT